MVFTNILDHCYKTLPIVAKAIDVSTDKSLALINTVQDVNSGSMADTTVSLIVVTVIPTKERRA